MTTCLCRYLTPERARAAGVDIKDMVCIFCSRAGMSFRPLPAPVVEETPEVQRLFDPRTSVEERAAALERLASIGALAS